MAQPSLVIVGFILTLVLLALAGVSVADERRQVRRRRRLSASRRKHQTIAVLPGSGMGSRSLALSTRHAGASNQLARWLPGGEKMRNTLDRTGRSISLTTYASWTGAVGGAALLLASLVLHAGLLVSLAIAGAVAFFVPRFVVMQMAKRRLAAFIRQFPDAIDLIVRALRAGLPLTEALVTISAESPNPVGAEFRKVVGALAISRSLDEALWGIERTIDSAELRFFIISIATQMQTGGNLGETLGNLATILRQRSQMRMKVKAMTGEARASAAVLGSLPFIIALLMMFTNPGYIAPLFSDPRGWVLLGGGALMLLIGIGTMAKMVSFEV